MSIESSSTSSQSDSHELGADTNIQKFKKSRAKKFMFLRVGPNTFALPLTTVREVLGLGQISTLPNMPAYFAGLINLRGKIISAVYLQKSLNFLGNMGDIDKSRRPCVIITEVSGRMFGAIVDDVVEVLAIADENIDHAVDNLNNKDVFDGIIKKDGAQLAPILNLNKALRISEFISLNTQIPA
jgi:purine-binding chemotaxis protein CheW